MNLILFSLRFCVLLGIESYAIQFSTSAIYNRLSKEKPAWNKEALNCRYLCTADLMCRGFLANGTCQLYNVKENITVKAEIMDAANIWFKDYYQLSKEKTACNEEALNCRSLCSADPMCKGSLYNGTCQLYNVNENIRDNAEIYDVTNIWVKGCPEGFVGGIYGVQCYLNVDGVYNMTTAKEFCGSKNSYLAELMDPMERDAVWNYAKSQGYVVNSRRRFGVVQLDPNERGQFRTYKWEKADLTIPGTGIYWANRYTQATSPENCGYMRLDTGNSKFHDAICGVSMGLICEW